MRVRRSRSNRWLGFIHAREGMEFILLFSRGAENLGLFFSRICE